MGRNLYLSIVVGCLIVGALVGFTTGALTAKERGVMFELVSCTCLHFPTGIKGPQCQNKYISVKT